LKVGMITSSYPRFEGDIAGTFVRSLAEQVASLGHEVHVLAAYDPALREPPSSVQVHRFRYAPWDSWYRIGYAKSLESDVALRKEVYPLLPLYAMAASAGLYRWHRRVRFDVIHAHWVVPGGAIGALVAALTGVPLVVSLHGSDVFVVERNVLAGWAARWAFRLAREVTSCSSDLLERAQRHGLSPAKSRLVPYGVDHQRFRKDEQAGLALRQELRIAPEAPVVLALGRLVYKKGFEYLVRAMPDIVQQFPQARVVIAGGGPLRHDLKQLAAELGVAQHLVMADTVRWDDTVRYFNMADVFVVPSIRDHQGNVDGLPNVVLEAMACGKPLVASRVAGIPQVLVDGENGLLIDEKDHRGIAAAVVRLLASPALAHSCGQANRQKMEQELTWRSIAVQMVELYEGAIAALH
jgi:glycosyltransferase involved in cell wall biosynthesis